MENLESKDGISSLKEEENPDLSEGWKTPSEKKDEAHGCLEESKEVPGKNDVSSLMEENPSLPDG